MPQQGKTLEMVLLASASRSATISSVGDKLAAQYDELLLCINVSTGGTSTWVLNYQVSFDDGTTWLTHSSVGPSSGNQALFLNVSKIGAMGRVNCVYGGSGSGIFAVYGVYKKLS